MVCWLAALVHVLRCDDLPVWFWQLEQKEVTPPFKPQVSDDYGLENFDTQFTNEPVQLTPDDE